MRDYELMVVIDPNLDEAGVEAVTSRVTNLVTQRNGTVESIESGAPWGRRRLAYPISRFRDGFYVLARLRLPGDAPSEVERALKLSENVMRHLLVRLDEPAPRQAAEQAPRQAAAEQAPRPAAAAAPARQTAAPPAATA